MCTRVCVCVRARARVRACVCACVCARVRVCVQGRKTCQCYGKNDTGRQKPRDTTPHRMKHQLLFHPRGSQRTSPLPRFPYRSLSLWDVPGARVQPICPKENQDTPSPQKVSNLEIFPINCRPCRALALAFSAWGLCVVSARTMRARLCARL